MTENSPHQQQPSSLRAPPTTTTTSTSTSTPTTAASSLQQPSSYASVLSGTAHVPQRFTRFTTDPPLPHTTTSSHLPSIDADMQTNPTPTPSSRDPLPFYSRKFANSSRYNDYMHGPGTNDSDHPFLTPSYLRNSRYISRLEAAHHQAKAKQSPHHHQRDAASTPPRPHPFSYSTAGNHRMAPSHRGMTYDIIERPPFFDDDDDDDDNDNDNDMRRPDHDTPMPLPSRWSDSERHLGLDLSNGGLETRYMGPGSKNDQEAASIRADHPMPPQCGIYYFEITVLSKPKEGMIGIGFSSNKASLERLPGWEQESWAYHGDDGKTFFGENPGQGRPYGPTFGTHDAVGCGVNFSTGRAFFTKNGIFLGYTFRDLRDVKLYPSIGVKKQPGVTLIANFGQQPFVFDIDGMVKQEKQAIRREISATNTSNLQPPLDESALLHELVAQFLAHDGYVETARAFAEEVAAESTALVRNGEEPLKKYEVEDDVDAINRQKIRAAILDGDIDRAFKYTNAYYANVLQDMPHIQFKLRCRKFLEMMRRCNELSLAASKREKSSNGTGSADGGAMFSQEMEVDDQMHDGHGHGNGDWGAVDKEEDGMDIEEQEPDPTGKFNQLLTEAVQYGQQLRMDYPSDENGGNKKLLNDIFSLVAYSDPRKSIHGHYLDPKGRAAVAEELNSAILVSLGKSSSAALERLYQQTEALVNEISEEGGAGAFVNIGDDFLL